MEKLKKRWHMTLETIECTMYAALFALWPLSIVLALLGELNSIRPTIFVQLVWCCFYSLLVILKKLLKFKAWRYSPSNNG